MDEKVEEVAKYLPSILMLKDKRIATAIANVWLKMLEISCWKNLGEARFKDTLKNVSLVSHVNSTIECALKVSEIIHKYHNITFDEQKIIEFGLLHDVDKMLEYVYDDNGNLVVSAEGKKIQHGVMSAIFAYNEGFDINMIHLILTHTTDSIMRTQDKEGILFGHMDMCDWEITCKFFKD